jgi:carbon storage regulator CsrA
MLVVKVDIDDYIVINNNIKVKVMKHGSDVRLAIDAPKEVPIQRSAVFERERALAAAATATAAKAA